jgi:hypothetical protein
MGWLIHPKPRQLPWYAGGLRFGCQACGRCCGGAPGYVWLDEEEVAEVAASLGLEAGEFQRRYVRRLWRGLSLREKENYDCVLLDGAGRCTAYEVRPLQCRIWPFWPSNLESPEAWDEAARRCPGIGTGPTYAFEQIEAQRMEMVV